MLIDDFRLTKNRVSMKNFYALFSILFLAAYSLRAQPTCEDPVVILEDDAESYASGDVSMQSPNWTVWPGGDAVGAVATDEQASGGVQSLKIDGSNNTDALFLLGDQTSGHYILQWDMLVPDSMQGYFNLQHEMPTEASGAWAFDVYFSEGGAGRLELYDGSDDVAFSYPPGEWFFVTLLLDLDNDEARLWIEDKTVAAWQFSTGSTDLLQMNSINFYPDDETYLFYLDNIRLSEIPPAAEGQYCYTAVEASLGTNTTPEIVCFGGGYDRSSDGLEGESGYWFRYVVETDGILSISSCGNALDSRGWIFRGDDCHNLVILGVNDDQCLSTDGNDYASYREALVNAGETVFIMWDNIWSREGFEWTLDISTDPLEEGQWCQSAIPIGPGEYFIDEILGDAAVTGPTIDASGGRTPHAQSIWYSFTPEMDGLAQVTSCEGAASDTRVAVYRGPCGTHLFDYDLIGLSDDYDGCGDGFQSQLDSIEMVAGETYYIEWADGWDDEPFIWYLNFEPLVDVTEAELDAGLQVFPNPASDLLNVRYEFEETADILNVQLVDALGRSLRSSRLNDVSAGTLEISLTGLPTGMYMLRVAADGAVATRPVVVRR